MVLSRYTRKALRALIKWAVENETKTRDHYDQDIPIAAMGVGSSKSASIRLGDGTSGLNLVVYSATGGKVIEVKDYDIRTDRWNTNMYVITDKENLGEELAQIITKESLCR